MHEYSDGNVLPICPWYAEKQATGWWHPNATGWTNSQAWSQDESQTGKVNPEEKKNKVCWIAFPHALVYIVLLMDFLRENEPEDTSKEKDSVLINFQTLQHEFPQET